MTDGTRPASIIAALRALLPPSEEAVKAVADAIAPHFSGADRAYKEHFVCANDAITAYITFIAGEGKL